MGRHRRLHLLFAFTCHKIFVRCFYRNDHSYERWDKNLQSVQSLFLFPKQSLNSTMLLGNILPDLYPVPSTDWYELTSCTLQTATLCFNNDHTHCELLLLKLKMSYSCVWAATALSSTPVQHKVNFSSHHPLAPLTLHAQENSHSAERHSLNSFIANLTVAWSSK